MSDVITGLFDNAIDASLATHKLEAIGGKETDISLLANGSYSKESFAIENNSKAPEGGLIGAATGGVLTAVVAGISAIGTAATGGTGVIVAGPLVGALATGSIGAVTGGVIGSVIGAFVPEHEIKFYEDAINEGKILIGVKHHNNTKGIEDVLENAGAESVATA
ncbi:hypothetical protein [Catenovulum sediminis]|uniref:hypothetical protein n=1 Tax=Catenovulum sediminis TaxID=1740262 RepID=UPI001181635F|nr:hypothetical protein [Catenovulum sediminis]